MKESYESSICREPLLGGIGEALKWGRIREIIDDNRGMIDLFLLVVDRDCKENRRQRLDNIEAKAKELLQDTDCCLIAENAWQEIEVWVLAGMRDLPKDWAWADIRAECNPKETYYDFFAQQRGVYAAAAEGRDVLGKAAAANYKTHSNALSRRRSKSRNPNPRGTRYRAMSMIPDAKSARSKTIRGLRQRLLDNLHTVTEMAYRLTLQGWCQIPPMDLTTRRGIKL